MFTKTKSFFQKLDWQTLRDTRTLSQGVFLIIVLLMTWSGAKTIQTNYNLQKQIATLTQLNQVQALQNDNLQLQNGYYNTNQYLELSARQEFGLAAPGETELLVPPQVAMTHYVPVSVISAAAPTSVHQAEFVRNFQAWLNFFLHRPSTTD